MRRRKLRLICRQLLVGMFAFAFTLALLLMGIKMMARAAHADSPSPQTKYFRSVEIMPGETLWGIAEREMGPGWADIRDYIHEVENVNGIVGDFIRAGDYICLPYYR